MAFGRFSWPGVVSPGERVAASVAWCYGEVEGAPAVQVDVFGNWEPNRALASPAGGGEGNGRHFYERNFSFTAPQQEGTYRIRWFLSEAFAGIDSFCSHEDRGGGDPGCSRWAESLLRVCR